MLNIVLHAHTRSRTTSRAMELPMGKREKKQNAKHTHTLVMHGTTNTHELPKVHKQTNKPTREVEYVTVRDVRDMPAS